MVFLDYCGLLAVTQCFNSRVHTATHLCRGGQFIFYSLYFQEVVTDVYDILRSLKQ